MYCSERWLVLPKGFAKWTFIDREIITLTILKFISLPTLSFPYNTQARNKGNRNGLMHVVEMALLYRTFGGGTSDVFSEREAYNDQLVRYVEYITRGHMDGFSRALTGKRISSDEVSYILPILTKQYLESLIVDDRESVLLLPDPVRLQRMKRCIFSVCKGFSAGLPIINPDLVDRIASNISVSTVKYVMNVWENDENYDPSEHSEVFTKDYFLEDVMRGTVQGLTANEGSDATSKTNDPVVVSYVIESIILEILQSGEDIDAIVDVAASEIVQEGRMRTSAACLVTPAEGR